MFEVKKTENPKPKTKDRIIVALDVPTAVEARTVIGELRGEVGAFKIGLQLFTAAGASFVRETVETGIKIFLDVKFHDIPNTVAGASVEAARLGVWMFNVHAFGGSRMMRRVTGEVREVCEKENLRQPKIIGVTVLTSADQETLKEVGIEEKTDLQVLRLAQLTAKCGLDGVVASPLEVEAIRQTIEKKDFLIVTPGIRPDAGTPARHRDTKVKLPAPTGGLQQTFSRGMNETFDDQKRVMTPGKAVRAGADFLVIGRPVLQAADKIQAIRQILEEIDS